MLPANCPGSARRGWLARPLNLPPILRATAPGLCLLFTLAVPVGISLLGTPATAAPPTLETFVVAAGGRANATFDPPCTSGGPPEPVYNFFGGWGVGVPQAGLSLCSVAGDIADVFSPTGPLSVTRTVSSSWPTNPTNTFSGEAIAGANYGRLSARTHSVFSGELSNLNITGTDAFGIADEGFTITTPSIPNGQSGSVVFRVTISGSYSMDDYGWTGVEMYNRVNYGPGYGPVFSSYCSYATSTPTISSVGNTGQAGFTLSPGGISGSGEVTGSSIPIVFGTQFDYRLGLLAFAVPGKSSTSDSHFDAQITGIEVRGPSGEVVNNFVVGSASGAPYGPGGAITVDVPPREGLGEVAHLSAFPNPAKSRVELRYTLSRAVTVQLEIYDSAGRRVRQLDPGSARAGDQATLWDGRSDEGSTLPSGAYFARLTSAQGSVTTRITLLR